MALVPVRVPRRTFAAAAVVSLAAGLLTALAPAAPASARRIPARPGPARSGHKILLRNGEHAYLNWAPAKARPHAPVPAVPKLIRNGRLLARPANITTGTSTGSISGLVTGAGQPLAGICVVAIGQVHASRYVTTSKAGTYRITGLQPDRYAVGFLADATQCPNKGNWLIQWYRRLDSQFPPVKAVRVRVRAGHDAPDINAKLRPGGQITGAVRNTAGKPLGRICVLATAPDQSTQTRTDAQGRYTIGGLFPGKYDVEFHLNCGARGNYAFQWWPGRIQEGRAKPVRLTGRRIVKGIDAVLRPGALITGSVKGADASHQPLAGVCLSATPDGFLYPPAPDSADAITKKGGRFELKGLAPGKYLLLTDPTCTGKKASFYLVGSQRLTVKAAQVRHGLAITLQPGAGASGRVTTPQGRPIKGICVDFADDQGDEASTGADGRYRIIGLKPGTYGVQFSGGCGNSVSVLSRPYPRKVGFRSGVVTTGINAVLQPGASVVGTVTDKAGHPLSNVCVSLIAPQDFNIIDNGDGPIGFTNSAGHYRIPDVIPGPYEVVADCGAGPFAQSWFRSAPDSSSASVLSARAGVSTPVDFKLARAGSVAGTVADASGHPLRNVCVLLASPKTKLLESVPGTPAVTGIHGQYSYGNVEPGRYLIQFSDCESGRLGTHWFSHRTTAANFATPVTIKPGQRTGGIDAVMSRGATISGTVTGPGGKPVRNICAQAYDRAALAASDGISNDQGHYSVTGLGTGSYVLSFAPCGVKNANLGSITVPGQTRVTAPRTSTVNVRLKPGGSISGVVLHGSSPHPQTCAAAVPTGSQVEVQAVNTDAHGRYVLPNLAPGTYDVYFGDIYCLVSGDPAISQPYAPQWYGNQPTQVTATAVAVSAGHITTGIDAKLAPFGSVSGSVSSIGQKGLSRECVTAFSSGGAIDPLLGLPPAPETAVSASSGTYSLLDLLPGQYKVEFSSGCGLTGYASQWWHGAASEKSAQVINVGFTPVNGITASLRRR